MPTIKDFNICCILNTMAVAMVYVGVGYDGTSEIFKMLKVENNC